MTYRRASNKQLEFIQGLCEQLGEPIPFLYRALSGTEAARHIRRLLKLRQQLREKALQERQIKLL